MQLPIEKRQYEVLTKKRSRTNNDYGQDPNKRPMLELIRKGFVLIDKPKGPTSHQVSFYVRDLLCIKKAGHTGTLDPKVSGVLPVMLNDATRLIDAMHYGGKEYVCLMKLQGNVDENLLKKTIMQFVGKIEQMPPVRSAVKRELRTREVFYIEILEIEQPFVLFKVGCESGTYIRTICHNIGETLKIGAHMQELRRTKVAGLHEDKLIFLSELIDAMHYYTKENDESYLRKIIHPMEQAVEHLSKIYVLDTTVDMLTKGQQLAIPGISKLDSDIKKKDLVAIFTLKNELVCIGEALISSKEIMEKQKGIAVKSKTVFIDPGIYPKYVKPK